MKFCIPLVLFLVSFNAGLRTDIYTVSFDAGICLLSYPTIKFVSLLLWHIVPWVMGQSTGFVCLGHSA
jgi:hypothetical protein